MSIRKLFNYSPNFDLKKRKNTQIKFLIFHYTGMKKESDEIKRLTNIKSKVSSHYLIKRNGDIVVLVPDLFVAWHAGKSYWQKFKLLNKNSIGIEISNPGHKFNYKKFSKRQINSILKLSKFLILKYKIDKKNIFSKVNKNIEINLKNISTSLSKELYNFKLIGNLSKGKFVKISAKGEFGDNKFLDISMRSDTKNKKKYLEIYSDIPQPLLANYSFFKGLTEGILHYSSIIEENNSSSKLKIENFKIINAPGLVKLLSLADLGGLADLAEGEGLSFSKMEIKMNDINGFLKLNELYADGSSISVLMEGYKEKSGLTSLKGTLVPAKNLNKLLSKIPVIGKVIIPEQVGEGLFGVSFKIKGTPGKMKTTINPIKTLTPRFITKALEKTKNAK